VLSLRHSPDCVGSFKEIKTIGNHHMLNTQINIFGSSFPKGEKFEILAGGALLNHALGPRYNAGRTPKTELQILADERRSKILVMIKKGVGSGLIARRLNISTSTLSLDRKILRNKGFLPEQEES
jgi:hypothetical protein